MSEELNYENRGTLNPAGAKKAKKKRRATPGQAAAGRGNLIAFRETNPAPALKHGCKTSVKATGQVPAAFAHLQSIIDEFHSGWVSDAGGLEGLTYSKRALLLTSKGCLAAWLLALEYIKTHGLVNPEGEVQSVAKTMASFANTMRLNLTAVGLERQARAVGGSALEAKFAEIIARENEGNDEAQQD